MGEGVFVLEVKTVPVLGESSFYQFVREERFFCSILAHLLMQEGPNLQSFLDLVSEKTGDRPLVKAADVQHAEIYLEFSFLRDYWDSLGRDNGAKRRFIFDSLSKIKSLRHYGQHDFPEEIHKFNGYFMGDRGSRIQKDIVFPGQWTVEALFQKFRHVPDQFRDFCRFKWSFNIKPDIVLLIPGAKPICIEAKLESSEGRYPTRRRECERFDELFGEEQGRVGQIELQRFMFAALLDSPCESLFLGRNPGSGPSLTWHEAFEALDLSSSIGFVRALVEENRHIRRRQ